MRYQVVSKHWFKNFILNLGFVNAELNRAYKQGGVESFPLAQKDILETMRDDLDKQAEELCSKKLATLLTVVDPNMIITFSTREKAVFIGGEKVSDPALLQSLKAEAELLLSSTLWRVIYETPKELAQKAMFVAGESVSDMTKGRAMLHTLETQKKILETFQSYQHVPTPPQGNRGV